MAKAKKKIGIIDFVVLGVLVVCLVLAIVCLTIDQWTTTEEVFGKTVDVSFGDYSEIVVEKNEMKGDTNDALGDDIMSGLDYPPPMHLRDAHYKDAQKYGFGKGYVYTHDNPEYKQQFMPDELIDKKYFT